MKRSKHGSRGAALILVLWLVASLSLVVMGTWILCGHNAAGFASTCGWITPPGAIRASITRG